MKMNRRARASLRALAVGGSSIAGRTSVHYSPPKVCHGAARRSRDRLAIPAIRGATHKDLPEHIVGIDRRRVCRGLVAESEQPKSQMQTHEKSASIAC